MGIPRARGCVAVASLPAGDSLHRKLAVRMDPSLRLGSAPDRIKES